jgi:hypothetical protein
MLAVSLHPGETLAAQSPAAASGAVQPVGARAKLPGHITALFSSDGGMSLDVKRSVACLGTGAVATAASLAADPANLTFVMGGGIVPIANMGVLGLGLVAVVFTSFCAIGAALAPIYLYYTGHEPSAVTPEPKHAPAEAPGLPAGHGSAAQPGTLQIGY